MVTKIKSSVRKHVSAAMYEPIRLTHFLVDPANQIGTGSIFTNHSEKAILCRILQGFLNLKAKAIS